MSPSFSHSPLRFFPRRTACAALPVLVAALLLPAALPAQMPAPPTPPAAPALAPLAPMPPLLPAAPDIDAQAEAYAKLAQDYAQALKSTVADSLADVSATAWLKMQQAQTTPVAPTPYGQATTDDSGTGSTLDIALSHPDQPAVLHVALVNGRITVKAGTGKNMVIEDGSSNGFLQNRPVPPEAAGMHRLTMPRGLSATEDNNQVTVTLSGGMSANLTITVPPKTSVILRSVSGAIAVSGIDGDIEVQTTSGAITLSQVSGSVVANSLNGKILATMTSLDPSKPTAFSSLNGSIDVALPPALKANLYMRSDRGDVYTDFDLKPLPAGSDMTPPPPPPVPASPEPANAVQSRDDAQQMRALADQMRALEDKQARSMEEMRGMNRVEVDRAVRGTINGGGPQIQFRNFNGNIYIRKAK